VRDATERYATLLSVVITDRSGVPIRILENAKGHYALTGGALPESFRNSLLAKEDQYFFYHPGVNPVSLARALYRTVTTGRGGGSSTITEQLAKNLLGTENERTVSNKLRELVYVFGLELFLRKDTILTMYGNTVFLGNQVQGFETASRLYFGTELGALTPHEASVLLATLSYPTARNPLKAENAEYAKALYARITGASADTFVLPQIAPRLSFRDPAWFELSSLGVTCSESCATSLDTRLTEFIRTALARTISREYDRGVKNGAVVVIDARTHELLALVGSPDPEKTTDGGQINMALEPRPIGSTIKPFIYLRGFMEGLRPYTLVDDREYRYPIATGYSLYPKNFDGKYHGPVTLHFALANSLNVPSVKVLEYIGLPHFYSFLGADLGLIPIQAFDSYQYGIALGGLETDLLTLSHFFTIFPTEGLLSPLRVVRNSAAPVPLPHARPQAEKRIATPAATRLVTKILSDRLTGVEQFGLASSLNLSSGSGAYAVKTGTSRDFHDSWVVGYTPDFVVGVWLGNSENTPLAQVSGQSGAGTVWRDVMDYLLSSPYNTQRSFSDTDMRLLTVDGQEEWGLSSDNPAAHRDLLIADALITSVHEGDTFAYEADMRIPLRARAPLTWYANGRLLGTGTDLTFTPPTPGRYEIEGRRQDEASVREIISITVVPAPDYEPE
jgi:membrane carboxypeptidase/penicillin-binding protein PbpC